jgi:hypothetical protein
MDLQVACLEPGGLASFVVETIDGGRTRRSDTLLPPADRVMSAGAIEAWPEGTAGAMRFGDVGLMLRPGFEEIG